MVCERDFERAGTKENRGGMEDLGIVAAFVAGTSDGILHEHWQHFSTLHVPATFMKR